MSPHLSSSLLCSSLLTFRTGFHQMNQKVARSDEHASLMRIRWVTGISKSAFHLGSGRLNAVRLRSIRPQIISLAEYVLGSSATLTRARPDEGRRSRRGGYAAALAGGGKDAGK